MTSKRGYYRRQAAVTEIIHESYGMIPVTLIAARIKRETGVVMARSTVVSAATEAGLDANTAQGLWCIADAARELGIQRKTLERYVEKHGIRTSGKSRRKFLPDGTMERLRALYAAPPEPTIGAVEAARRLAFSRARIHQLCERGEIRAYKWGSKWCVAVAEIDRILRQRTRERLLGKDGNN